MTGVDATIPGSRSKNLLIRSICSAKNILKKMLLVSRAQGWMPYHMSAFIDISTEHKRG